MKKHIRQRIILDLIENYQIETQEELLEHLIKRGINITQATVSRDIKDLRLIKVQVSDGKYRYATMDNQHTYSNQRMIEILRYYIKSIEKAGNLIVIKTIPNAAKICSSAIENNKIDGVVGTIAGEDTIFVAVRDANMADMVIERINNLLK